MTEFQDTSALIGQKIAGFTVDAFLNSDDNCQWYEVHADNGDQEILYVYPTKERRDALRHLVYGFRTCMEEILQGSHEQRIYANFGAHRLMMPKDLRELLTAVHTRPPKIDDYLIERVLGFGFKGVTYEVRRDQGPSTPYALKVTIAKEYEGRTCLPEADRMVSAAATDRDHFAQIHGYGTYTYHIEDKDYELVYFVQDFIHGQTLEKVLESDPHSLDASFLNSYVHEMLAAVATMQKCGLMHDDLHAGNVMLHEPPTGRRRPYIIDFGSAKPIGVTKKPRDDIRNLASQIADIANTIQLSDYARTGHEEQILKSCESLLAVISDDDPMRRPEDAMEILERFERSFAQGSVKQELLHPFDFGNAEEVMDNSLLYSLAAKSFPWRDQIEASSHLLVIGPRGCGKTTVFRSLSFRCLADAGQIEKALQRPYLGLYVSCNKEFRQRFSAIDKDILVSRQDDIRHYFNLIVLRELASVFVALSNEGRLFDTDLIALQQFLMNQADDNIIQGSAASAAEIEAQVTRAVQMTRMAIWKGKPLSGITTQGFVADLADFVASCGSLLSGKTLYLFVDDYTELKVPKEAQHALNHILFVPNSQYKCKVSSEVFGLTHDESVGSFLEKDREYREWNIGTEFCLNLPSKSQTEFLKEIVDNRLSICDYGGGVDSLIGRSKYFKGTLERTLRYEAELRKAKKGEASAKPAGVVNKEVERQLVDEGVTAHYHGWETICNLCTGDVSNILELLNRMFEQCAVKRDSDRRIPAEHQDEVIQSYSLQYVSKIKGIPGYGERMFSIVDAFGNMARRLLEEHPLVGQRQEPYRLLRIELDEAVRDGNGIGKLSALDSVASGTSDALELWMYLQRYCIFIDAEESRSRRNTLSSRVLFRRILCPAFRIGLVNSESWTLSRQQWEAFTNDPSGRAELYAKTSIERSTRRSSETQSDKQRPLFPEYDDEGQG